MLATVSDLRRYLHTQGTVSAGAQIDEALLAELLNAASARMTAQRPERTLEPTAEDVELRFPLVAPTRVVQVPDLRVVTSIAHDGRALAAGSGYVLRRRPMEQCALWVKLPVPALIDGELVITGRWGPADARIGDPDDEPNAAVKDACLVWAARAYHNRAARFADNAAGGPGNLTLGYFRNLPPDVKLVLDGLQVPGL